MSYLRIRVEEVFRELRDEVQDAVTFIRRQGWNVQESRSNYLQLQILEDTSTLIGKNAETIPGLSTALYSRVTFELKQITIRKQVLVRPNEVERALEFCARPSTREFFVDFVPHVNGKPDWPLLMWDRSRLLRYVKTYFSAYYKELVDRVPLRVLRKFAWTLAGGALDVKMIGSAAVVEDLHAIAVKDVCGSMSGYFAAAYLIKTGDVHRSGTTTPEEQLTNECPDKRPVELHEDDYYRHYVKPSGEIVCIEKYSGLYGSGRDVVRPCWSRSTGQKRVDREQLKGTRYQRRES